MWMPLSSLILIAGCRPPDAPPEGVDPDPTDSGGTPTPTGTTGVTGTTGDTAVPTEPEPAFDCTALPVGPFVIDSLPIGTTEDFDFDALGNLIYSDSVNFVAVDSTGNFSVVAPGIPDTRGIQVLSDGNILAAYISEGRLGYTDRSTGASVTWLSGMAGPNALDVGAGDLIYATETGRDGGATPRVITFDPVTQERRSIATGFFYPNGLALNEAQDRLYIADSGNGLYVIERDASGDWGPKEVVWDPGFVHDALEVDICGNIYAVNFETGELYRIDPETRDAVLLVDLDDPLSTYLWNAARWGSGRGMWQRNVLYVTDRNRIFGVHLGVPGRSQPVDAMP